MEALLVEEGGFSRVVFTDGGLTGVAFLLEEGG